MVRISLIIIKNNLSYIYFAFSSCLFFHSVIRFNCILCTFGI